MALPSSLRTPWHEMIADDALWQAGDQLPNENELAVQLGISRATLREAIHLLAAQGILVVHRGKGTFVAAGFSAAAGAT